ncbi:MAG: S-adenosyl-l-methionine hydroxide adenosyltransferase family protein [Candidatus Zixiibacteriota bacterium]
MSKKKRLITLLTDFGDTDSYLTELKGVIYSINPEVEIVEASQKVKAGNIRQGAYLLGRYFRYYPEGTIHLAVVDPGVGSRRFPILLETERYFLVGPDNGLFSYALAEQRPQLIVRLANERYQLPSASRTFEGRDVFAPAAAYLSLDVDPTEFGPELEEIETLRIHKPEVRGEQIEGEIVHIDHFGNVATNIPLDLLTELGRFVTMTVKGRAINKLVTSYEEGKDCEFFVITGSGATLEISSFGKDAGGRLNVSPGDKVYLTAEKT